MAKTTKRFLLTWEEELEDSAKLQKSRHGDTSLASYLRRLVIEDVERDNTGAIKIADVYNKVVDVGVAVSEIKEKMISGK